MKRCSVCQVVQFLRFLCVLTHIRGQRAQTLFKNDSQFAETLVLRRIECFGWAVKNKVLTHDSFVRFSFRCTKWVTLAESAPVATPRQSVGRSHRQVRRIPNTNSNPSALNTLLLTQTHALARRGYVWRLFYPDWLERQTVAFEWASPLRSLATFDSIQTGFRNAFPRKCT